MATWTDLQRSLLTIASKYQLKSDQVGFRLGSSSLVVYRYLKQSRSTDRSGSVMPAADGIPREYSDYYETISDCVSALDVSFSHPGAYGRYAAFESGSTDMSWYVVNDFRAVRRVK